MKGLTARFKKKLGPLPLWAWAAVAAGALGYYLQRRSSTAAQAAAGATDNSLGAVDVPAADTSSLGGTGTSDGGTGTDSQAAGPLTASQEWGDAGITSDFQDFMSQLESKALADAGNTGGAGTDGSTTDATGDGTDTKGRKGVGIDQGHPKKKLPAGLAGRFAGVLGKGKKPGKKPKRKPQPHPKRTAGKHPGNQRPNRGNARTGIGRAGARPRPTAKPKPHPKPAARPRPAPKPKPHTKPPPKRRPARPKIIGHG